jgi:ComF family protein
VREVVHAFKYEGRRHLCKLLADWMQEALADPRLRNPPVEAWVPVPLHRSRLRTRGFNQAGLLAAELGRRTGVEVWDVLERVRSTGSQAQLGRDERLGNLRGAFQLKRSRLGADAVSSEAASIAGRHIVLVDDVLTTGATLDACTRALLAAAPGSVRALTVARG